MSGIVGVFPHAQASVDDAAITRMLWRMRARGTGLSAIWRAGGAVLAVTRNGWESDPEFSGAALVVRDGDLAVAADASLYYRSELESKLAGAGVRVPGSTPSHLILAAYRAWGEECVRSLEGDYAFILWDAARRQVFCARDFAGSRPLFYAEVGDALIVASTQGALRAYPDCPTAFNVTFLAEAAANVWLPADETAYTALRALPAGFGLSRTRGGTTVVSRHWHPPAIDSRDAPPFADAAAELRQRLRVAVEERLATHHGTAVWMSGGRDSSAVFASGQAVMREQPANGRRLSPISVSFPQGDLGREDEFITAIARHWGAPIQWLDIRDIPFFDRPAERAVRRDEPWALPYEGFKRALAGKSRAVGARVALDGWGGDQLFQVSPIHLADLFRGGRWLALAREWRALGVRDLRYFVRMAITPSLPQPLRVAARILRGGRPLPLESDAWIPSWVRRSWATVLKERQRAVSWGGASGSFASAELHTFLTNATMARVRGWLSSLALEEGLEARSPLYDARIIELAVRRPASERRAGRDTKRLLRAAMGGLLPEHVLAPRSRRTGVTDHYLRNSMRATYPRLLDDVLRSPVALAELGIIEPGAWRRAARACLADSWNPDVAMALCFTLHTEHWLRARMHESTSIMDLAEISDDGQSLAVLPGGKPGFTSYSGGATCT